VAHARIRRQGPRGLEAHAQELAHGLVAGRLEGGARRRGNGVDLDQGHVVLVDQGLEGVQDLGHVARQELRRARQVVQEDRVRTLPQPAQQAVAAEEVGRVALQQPVQAPAHARRREERAELRVLEGLVEQGLAAGLVHLQCYPWLRQAGASLLVCFILPRLAS